MPDEASSTSAKTPETGTPKPPPAKKPAKPARELPTADDIAAWVAGADLPSLSNLFNLLSTKLFDAKVMQIKKEEILPQHWQVITSLEAPDDARFDELGEVARLRARYSDAAVAERRVEAARVVWQELRGKQPSLWNASDVFAALRRIIDKKREVDFHDTLSAVRDVWRGLSLPHGREQLEVLWACLEFIRSKTRK